MGPFYQRVSLWIGALVATYTLVGALIVPLLLPVFLPSYLAKNHGIYLDVSRARLNPFTFSLWLHDVRLDDQYGATALRIDTLFVNANPTALVANTVAIETLRIIKPRVFVTITTDGRLNVAHLLPPALPKEESASAPSSLHFLLKNFDLKEGSLTYTDASKADVFSTSFQGLNYTARDLSTKFGAVGAHHFGGAGSLLDELGWEGGVSLNPLKLYGNVWLENARLKAFWDYMLHDSPYTLANAHATLRLPYLAQWDEEGLHVSINDAQLQLTDVALLERAHPFFSAVSLGISQVQASISMTEEGLKGALRKGNFDASGLAMTYANALHATLNTIAMQGMQGVVENQQAFALLPSTRVQGFWVAKAGEEAPFGTLEALHVRGISVQEKTLHVKEIALDAPFIQATLLKDGSVDLVHLLPPAQTPQETSSSPFLVQVEKVRLEGGEAVVLGMPQTHRLRQLSLEASGFSSDLLTPVTYTSSALADGAKVTNTGTVTIAPFHAQGALTLAHPNLPHYAPYLTPFFHGIFASGALELQSSYTVNDDFSLHATSAFTLNNMAIHNHANTPLMRWKELDVKNVKLDTAPLSLHVEGVRLLEPYVSLHIRSDMSTNVGELFPKNADVATQSSSAPLDIRLSRVELKGGLMDFKDDSLPLPFATNIHSLKGTLSTLDFTSTQPSKLALTGSVNEYGYVQIDGEMLPFDLANHIDIGVLFKNIDLTRLSPYSGKFVGYAISDGRLDLDLGYKVRQKTLQGNNSIVLQTLTLGERIESPEALNLPLNLAIALLKDRNGRIDLNLPVHGDLNDPQFSYGAIIWRAVTNVLTSIVTSPFRLLGSLLGIDGETLKAVDFDAGVATLLPSEEEKMAHYRKILEERPQLRLNITGTYHVVRDTAALQQIAAQERIDAEIKKGKAYEDVLVQWFSETFSKERLETLQKTHTKEGKLDVALFHEAMLSALQKSIAIPQEALDTLAKERAEALKEALAKAGVAPEKLDVQEPKEGNVKSERWIETAVEVSA
ncbi:MAG: DUF748 domain-containing protein [Campylobacterales bacterium]|nr:DUF748 domain-containing protein [Campylobacterales bacterium]